MSIETTFVAALDAHAPLVALVGTRISKNEVDQDAALPLVVFNASHDPQIGIDGAVQVTQSTFTVECWAEDGDQAAAVADAVEAALAAFNAVQTSANGTVINRAGAYDGEQGLHSEALTVDWWSQ